MCLQVNQAVQKFVGKKHKVTHRRRRARAFGQRVSRDVT